MKRMKRYGRLLYALLLPALLLSGCGVSSSGTAYAREIDKTELMTISISADPSDWADMLQNAEAEEYISADITINGTTMENVGIRPKGNSSLRQIANDDTTDRFSFKIKFNEYVDDQTWLGLDKIVINNMFSDSTYMKEYLSYDIMSYIGVAAPLFAFADIKVNGETWGLYLAVEDLDSGYLDRVYGGEGELYKPENEGVIGHVNQQDGGGAIRLHAAQGGGVPGRSDNGVSLRYTDDQISSYSAIFDNAETKTDESDEMRMITALKHLSEGTDLNQYIDVDAALRYFAAHTVVVNLDSYNSNMCHNYYLYENNGRITILPWDYNMAFGGFQSGSASDIVNFPIDTPVSGVSLEERPLLSQLLAVPEYKDAYHNDLQKIVDGYFSDGRFARTVDSLDALISEYVKDDPTAFCTFEQYQTAVGELKKLGALRAESIQGQLDGTVPSTSEKQRQDPDDLIDASSVNLQSLGNRGSNRFPNAAGEARQAPAGQRNVNPAAPRETASSK